MSGSWACVSSSTVLSVTSSVSLFRRHQDPYFTHAGQWLPDFVRMEHLFVPADRDRCHSSTAELWKLWEPQYRRHRNELNTWRTRVHHAGAHAIRASQRAVPQLWLHSSTSDITISGRGKRSKTLTALFFRRLVGFVGRRSIQQRSDSHRTAAAKGQTAAVATVAEPVDTAIGLLQRRPAFVLLYGYTDR